MEGVRRLAVESYQMVSKSFLSGQFSGDQRWLAVFTRCGQCEVRGGNRLLTSDSRTLTSVFSVGGWKKDWFVAHSKTEHLALGR